MRVCFFGDSFVNGTGDDDGLGWVIYGSPIAVIAVVSAVAAFLLPCWFG